MNRYSLVARTVLVLALPTYGAPTITSILNNSSRIPLGFSNSGIAPSSLFVILGTDLSDPGDATLHSSEGTGLQATLNGANITVTVAGTTVHPAIYYATPTQVDAVLPAGTPTGNGILTVTYNQIPSSPAAIQVVTSALGFSSYNGSGVATDGSTGELLSYSQSGTPGETIILWGTGLGADPADSDTTYASSPHQQPNVPLQLYIGGVPANIVYQGASVYPGVTVIGAVIPASVPTGCFVPVAGIVGNTPSNIVTISISSNGGPCSDPQLGITGTQISTLNGQGTVNSGQVFVSQTTSAGNGSGAPNVISGASANFQQSAGGNYVASGFVSIGGCVLTQTVGAAPPKPQGLDAGAITVTSPSGVPVSLSTQSGAGFYVAQLPAGAIPTSGGSFSFKGAGGTQVGPFTAAVNFPNPLLSWTNQNAATAITRSQGLNVAWTGGAPGSYVSIIGSSTSGGASASYTCFVPQSAGQFTVPPYVLLALPKGSGSTMVQNSSPSSTFSASGLDVGLAFGSAGFSVNSTYE